MVIRVEEKKIEKKFCNSNIPYKFNKMSLLESHKKKVTLESLDAKITEIFEILNELKNDKKHTRINKMVRDKQRKKIEIISKNDNKYKVAIYDKFKYDAIKNGSELAQVIIIGSDEMLKIAKKIYNTSVKNTVDINVYEPSADYARFEDDAWSLE